MALGREVVDLVRLDLLDNADQAGGVREVAVVQDEAAAGGAEPASCRFLERLCVLDGDRRIRHAGRHRPICFR
jgi:hypothetical protein